MKFPPFHPTPARIAGVVLLAAAAAMPAYADYQSTVLSQGPFGYWRLNETLAPPQAVAVTNSGSLGTRMSPGCRTIAPVCANKLANQLSASG